MRIALALAVAGCAAPGAAPARTLSNATPETADRGGLFEMQPGALGPITAGTAANNEAIQAAVGARYRVKTIDDHGSEFHVFLGDELLFYVIPNDDGSLFNVHCTSPRVVITEHPEWVIGAPFVNADALDTCECWGTHPMCFRHGDHVAVGFAINCDTLSTAARRHALEGVAIQRAVWNPHAYGSAMPSTTPTKQPSVLMPP
jgi:hypothetical protein